MISTVTTVTTSTTTTTTAAAGMAATSAGAASMVAGFGLIATITLIVLLTAKELAGASAESAPNRDGTWACAMDGILNIGLLPLLMAFAVIVIMKIMAVL